MEEFKIPLRNKKGDIIDYAYVSEEDFENINQYKWCKYKEKSCKDLNYANGTIDQIPIKMHQLLLGPAPEGMIIDHRNNNGLDNRRENLRFVTPGQNSQNTLKREGTSSKYKGVVYEKKNKNWRMKAIDFSSSHAKEEEAAAVYDKYVLLKYGEGARTNGFVLWEDVKHLKFSEEFAKKKKLPSGIQYNSVNKEYTVSIMYKGEIYKSKCLKTLPEILLEYERIKAEIQLIKDMEDKLHIEKKITRNIEGIAIIRINNGDEVLVDDENWNDLSKYTWSPNGEYHVTQMDKNPVYMHIYIMEKMNIIRKFKEVIDHRNSIKYDNRVQNLRLNTCAGNAHNRLKKPNATSQYIGVSKSGKKWCSTIRKNNIKYPLGYFKEEIDAAKAYNAKAIELYGDCANLNVFE